MAVMSKLAQQIFAPVDENGLPREISEQDVAVWGTEVERLLAAIGAGDVDPADLPPTWVLASDAGAGTPNAKQATTAIPVTEAVLVIMNIAETNGPGPSTVRFNGVGPNYIIKTNTGHDPAAGGLPAGMTVIGRADGSFFRLLSDQASASIVSEAAAILEQIEHIRDDILDVVAPVYASTREAAKSIDILAVKGVYLTLPDAEGQFLWRAGDFTAEIASDPGEGIFMKVDGQPSTAGALVRQGGWAVSGADPRWWEYKADYNSETKTGTDNKTAIEAALATIGVAGILLPAGNAFHSDFTIPKGKFVRGVRWGFTSYEIKDPANISGSVLVSTAPAVMGSDGPTNTSVRHDQSSQLDDVTLFWHGQPTPPTEEEFIAGATWAAVDTPWAVSGGRFTDGLSDRAERISVRNVRVYGYSYGFNFERGGEDGELINIGGQPFKIGLRLDGIHHSIRVENPNFWVAWDSGSAVMRYMRQVSIAFQLGRVDDLQGVGTWFSFASYIALNLRGSRSPDFPGQASYFFNIERLYADSCARALVIDADVITTATGRIGQIVAAKSDDAGIPTGLDDSAIGIYGPHDIEVGSVEFTGPGFQYRGAGIISAFDGGRLKIGSIRTGRWDVDNAGKPLVWAKFANGLVEIRDPVRITLNNGWADVNKSMFAGNPSVKEANLKPGYFDHLVGIESAGGVVLAVDATAKIIRPFIRNKPVSEGAREFRVRVFVNSHATPTTFSISFSGNANVITTMTTAGSGSPEDLDSGWTKIGVSAPGTDSELGIMRFTGLSGMSALTIFNVVVEFRG